MTVGTVASAHVVPTGGGLVPTDLANLVMWLDGDDDTVFTYSTPPEATQWRDKSGNNRHVNGYGWRDATLNSRDVVRFIPSNFLSMSWTGTNTITGTAATAFTVCYLDGVPDSGERLLSMNESGQPDYATPGGGVFISAEGGTAFPSGYRAGLISHAPTVMHSQWLRVTSLFDGTNHTMYTGTTAYTPVANTGSFSVDQITIAASHALGENGDVRIAELIIYGDAKGSTDRTSIWNYLSTKWGI